MADIGTAVPQRVDERLGRGRKRGQRDAALRRECFEFFRGNQYVYRDRDNFLQNQGTRVGEKERHRVRQTWNLLADPVTHEVSMSTSRVPSYEVNASTRDPKKESAAAIAQKVAVYGYDKWRVLDATQSVVTHAVVADEGFAWPYFDNTVGAVVGVDENGQPAGEGEIKIRVFGANEVFWEPGVRFPDSRWHAVEQARPLDEVMNTPGLLGDVGKLAPDAKAASTPGGAAENMVMVTEYLERPSLQNPDGSWLTIANGRVICEEQKYPCLDPSGAPVDEPVLHYLSRIVDPDDDRDKGLVRFALDAQRAYNDSTNKIIEWKNMALNPQVILQNMKLNQRLTDEPGKVYQAFGSGTVIWRPVPQIPPELFQIRAEAKQYIQGLFSANDIPSGVEAAKAIQVLIERDENTRQGFTIRLAEFHSRLMRHCLYLVQRHYTEPRLVKIKGEFGWDTIEDFQGADLLGESDITVLPGSIEPRTRATMEQKIMNWAQLGWLDPKKAMSAIDTGSMAGLIDDYEFDVRKAYRQISKLRALAQDDPSQPAPPGAEVPIADRFDNPDVHMGILGTWFKTEEYEKSPPWVREAGGLLYEQYEVLKQQAAMQAAQQQALQAEQMGMGNAAAPQTGGKPLPSLPALPQ